MWCSSLHLVWIYFDFGLTISVLIFRISSKKEASFLVMLVDLLIYSEVTSLCFDKYHCHTFYSNETENNKYGLLLFFLNI